MNKVTLKDLEEKGIEEDIADMSEADKIWYRRLWYHECLDCGKLLDKNTVSTRCRRCQKKLREQGEPYRKAEKGERRREYWQQRDLLRKLKTE